MTTGKKKTEQVFPAPSLRVILSGGFAAIEIDI